MSSISNNFIDKFIPSFFNKQTEPKARLRLRMLLFTQKPCETTNETSDEMIKEII